MSYREGVIYSVPLIKTTLLIERRIMLCYHRRVIHYSTPVRKSSTIMFDRECVTAAMTTARRLVAMSTERRVVAMTAARRVVAMTPA